MVSSGNTNLTDLLVALTCLYLSRRICYTESIGQLLENHLPILTINLAAVVCVCVSVCVDVCQCAQFDQFLPARSHFESKRSENCVRIAKFPYAFCVPLSFIFLRETMI